MVIDQTKKRRLNYASWYFSSFLSAAACFFIFLWLSKTSGSQWLFAGALYASAILLTTFAVNWLIFHYCAIHLEAYKRRWKVGLISGSLLAGVWLSFNIFIATPPLDSNPFTSPYIVKLAYRGSLGVAMGLVLLFVSTWLATSIPNKRQGANLNSLFRASIKYMLPIALVWGIYLLAYLPAMMSSDSMDQWGQVLSGRFIDHHPAFHTFSLWLLTRIYFSPTSVAIAQIIALAFVAGLWLAFFETLGIRRWVIWVAAFIFALTPVNGTMVATVWKDIPYSTAVLGFTLIIARVVVTKGIWISRLLAQITLGVTGALVLLLRHDGFILAAGTLLLLIMAYPGKWKAWSVSILVCAGLYFGIRGPVYHWVGVEKPSTITSDSLSLYSIAAYARPGSEIDALAATIRLSSTDWSCSIWNDVTPEELASDLDRSITPAQAIGNLVRHLPNLLSYYVRCARSMEWVVWDPNVVIRNPSHAEVWIDKNPYGIQPDSKIPALRAWLSDWVVKTSYNPNESWYIWRPAMYLYLNLLLSVVLIIRNRDLRFGLLSVPILIQSISFSLILAEPNFRYHYAVYLVALITLPLFFSPRMTPIEETSNSPTQPVISPAESGI